MPRNSAGDTATQAKTRAEIFGTGDSSDNEDTGDKTKDTRTTQEMTTVRATLPLTLLVS